MIFTWAKRENIPVEGITILGGNYYINVAGLDTKVKNKCRDEGLVHKSTEIVDRLQEPTSENGWLCGRMAWITFFDKKRLHGCPKQMQNPGREQLEELREMFTNCYEARGCASPASIEGIAFTYKKTGNTTTTIGATRRRRRSGISSWWRT